MMGAYQTECTSPHTDRLHPYSKTARVKIFGQVKRTSLLYIMCKKGAYQNERRASHTDRLQPYSKTVGRVKIFGHISALAYCITD